MRRTCKRVIGDPDKRPVAIGFRVQGFGLGKTQHLSQKKDELGVQDFGL